MRMSIRLVMALAEDYAEDHIEDHDGWEEAIDAWELHQDKKRSGR